MDIIADEKTGVYRSGDLVVTPGIPEELLGHFYYKMKADGTFKSVFFDTAIGLRQYLDWARTCLMFGCFRENEDGDGDLRGLGWVNPPIAMYGGIKKSETGMCFVRGESETLAFGRIMLTMFFERNGIDILFGTTPVQNRAALRYAKALGFTLHGPIPNYTTWNGKLTGVWISHLAKADWMERN